MTGENEDDGGDVSGNDIDCRLYFHTMLSSWHINGFHGSRQRSSTYVILPWPWPAAQHPMAMAAAAIFVARENRQCHPRPP